VRQPPLSLALILLAVVFLLFVTVGALALSVNFPAGLWAVQVGLMFGVPYLLLKRAGHAVTLQQTLGRPRVGWIAAGVFFSIANYAVGVIPLQALAHFVFPAEWIDRYTSAQVFEGRTGVALGMILGGVLIAAPACEEYFFRGVLQRSLLPPVLPPSRAILLTAAIFSAFHGDPVGFVARVELGLLFGWLAWRTGSLWPAIAAHCANNLIGTAIYFAVGKSAETDPPRLVEVGLVFAVGALAFTAVWELCRRYGWLGGAPDPRR
jgi:membrane protease YdiL (CAAX protease family)